MAIKNFLREEMAMCTTNKVTSWECEGPLGTWTVWHEDMIRQDTKLGSSVRS